MGRFIKYTGILLFWGLPYVLYCGKPIHGQYKFNHLTIDDGLINNHVQSICQDAKGFMWFATRKGASRYDGYQTVNYYTIPEDSTTLSSGFLRCIFLDSRNNLWFGGDNGLDLYIPELDQFSRFSHNEFKDTIKRVISMAEDQFGILWIGTEHGVYTYNVNSGVLFHFMKDEKRMYAEISEIMVDHLNNLWFAVYNVGLYYYDQSRNRLVFYDPDLKSNKTLGSNKSRCFYQHDENNLWIGTYDKGIFVFNYEKEIFTNYIPDDEDEYSLRVRAIFQDFQGKIYAGTRAGLYALDNEKKSFYLYANEDHIISKLTQNSILTYFIDKTGTLWLGTYSGGVNYTDIRKKEFIHFKSGESSDYYLPTSNVNAITSDLKNNIWVGTDKGLCVIDAETFKIRHFFNNPDNSNSLSYNDVKALDTDHQGNIWIGTNNGGLNYYDVKKDRFYHFKHEDYNPGNIQYYKVFNLFNDRNNDLWVVTSSNMEDTAKQVLLLKEGSRKFIQMPETTTYGLTEGENGIIYIGTKGGFWIHNKKEDKTSLIKNDSLFGIVYSIHFDKKGQLWIGSDKGLVYFNREYKEYKLYNRKTGYPVTTVYGILEDETGNLWMSSDNGLLLAYNGVTEPKKIHFRVYDKDDGIQSKEFIQSSYHRMSNGYMLFGGINGLSYFNPHFISENKISPDITFTGLRIFNEKVKINESINGRIILNKSISETDEIVLGYKQNFFTIEFTALHYAQPYNNEFLYILEGFEQKWNKTGSDQRFATYTNLPGGEYVFKLKAANYDGYYTDPPISLKIIIKPPFWKSWWFDIIIILTIIFITLFIVRLRLINLSKQQTALKKLVEERTHELVESNKLLQKQKDTILKMSEFGQKLTATLKFEDIHKMIFEYVRTMMDVTNLGIGIYQEKLNCIHFPALMEEGIPVSPFNSSLSDKTSCAAWCFKNNEIIFSNDFQNEYSKYISEILVRTTEIPNSIVYVPLSFKGSMIGVLTVQSVTKSAYEIEDVIVLQTIGAYLAIAIENARIYKNLEDNNKILEIQTENLSDANAKLEETQLLLEEQSEELNARKEELEKHKQNLEQIVEKRTWELKIAKEKAEESDKLKASFLANISHEIRTPLHAIVGFAKLFMKSVNSPEKRNKFFHIMERNSKMLINLIENIIDISKIEAGQSTIQEKEYKVNELLTEIGHSAMFRLKNSEKKDLEISVELMSEDINIFTDVQKVYQIIMNFIENSINYTDKGYIKIGCKNMMKEKSVSFFVEDTGIGIEKEKMKFIFDRFTKIEGDRTKVYRGAGTGLYLSKKLADLINAKIIVNSKLGKGSNFNLSISLNNLMMKEMSQESSSEIKTYNWSGKTILVAEDETPNFMYIEELLSDTGVQLVRANDGVEVLDYINTKEFDLVLMDIRMPRMDGVEATLKLKKIKPKLPVLAVTAFALEDQTIEILAAGCSEIIPKPVDMDLLYELIDKYLSNFRNTK